MGTVERLLRHLVRQVFLFSTLACIRTRVDNLANVVKLRNFTKSFETFHFLKRNKLTSEATFRVPNKQSSLN